MKKLKEFLEDYKGWQIFFTRNTVGDIMETIYNEDGIQVDICHGWGYLEIFGLTNKQMKELEVDMGSLREYKEDEELEVEN